MKIQEAINDLIKHQNLSCDEITSVMTQIMKGKATDAQLGAFLIALRMKGETSEEIAASAKVIRSMAINFKIKGKHVVDIVGTGGDQAHTFNISTCAAFVVAAAGATVAKHNNKAVSSQSGSSDLLVAAGYTPISDPDKLAESIEHLHIGFLYAPNHHLSFKHTMKARQELACRTIFNILGPLVNPAFVKKQVIGVFANQWLEPMAYALHSLGSEHSLVVHSEDGLDEISISAPTNVCELKQDKIINYQINPEYFGIERSDISTIQVATPEESLNMVNSVLDNQASPARDIVVLNAGAAIYAADVANSLSNGIKLADQAITTGKAKQKLTDFIDYHKGKQS